MKRILALLFTLAMVFFCIVFAVTAKDAEATDGTPTSLTMMEGASVRLAEGESGLRFETRILTSELEALGEGATLGTLIIPTDVLGSTEFTKAVLDGEGEPYIELSGDDANVHYTVDGEYTVFYAAMIDVKEQNYARRFSARSYVKVGETYYYTAYSEASNARSIVEVAVEAWEGSYKDNAIVKSYLDKVILLSGALRRVPIAGYTSPFSVSYDGSDLTFSAATALAKSDLASVIIDGTVYTGGWEESEGKLTAPYTVYYYEDFDGLTSDTVTNATAADGASMRVGDFEINAKSSAADENPPKVSVSVKDAVGNSLGYMQVLYEKKDSSAGGTINQYGDLSEALGNDKTMLSISFSVRRPDGCPNATGFTGGLNGDDKKPLIFKITKESKLTVGGATVVNLKNVDDFVDVTIKADLANNKVYGYCNGELVQSGDLTSVSGYATLLDWAREKATARIFTFTDLCNKNSGNAGLCIDNLVIRVH